MLLMDCMLRGADRGAHVWDGALPVRAPARPLHGARAAAAPQQYQQCAPAGAARGSAVHHRELAAGCTRTAGHCCCSTPPRRARPAEHLTMYCIFVKTYTCRASPFPCRLFLSAVQQQRSAQAVSYTHLTLPTNREV